MRISRSSVLTRQSASRSGITGSGGAYVRNKSWGRVLEKLWISSVFAGGILLAAGPSWAEAQDEGTVESEVVGGGVIEEETPSETPPAAAEEAADSAKAAAADAEAAAGDAEAAAVDAADAAKAAADDAAAAAVDAQAAAVDAEAAATTASVAAAADDAAKDATVGDAKRDVQEVYITGSRVRRKDLNSASPVTVLNRADIDSAGLKSVGDILQNLPAQANAINTNFNNGGDGSTRINLRGLGSARTLVLVNGRRFVGGGTGANSSVDLNSIPSEMIERVEVLKDGASALYGSDALGGVVNLITRRKMSGLELSTYTGGTANGGLVYNLAATGGESSEKGGFLLSFQYFNQRDMMSSNRGFSGSDLDYDFNTGAVTQQGSGTVPDGNFRDRNEGLGGQAWQRIRAANGAANTFVNDPNVGYRSFQATGNSDTGTGDFYNYQPENYLVTPSQRISMWGQGDYEVGTFARAYFEASYNNRRSEQLLAPEPLSTPLEGITVSADNVYNPFGRDFSDVRRRLVENGNRIFSQDIDTYRAVVGLDGTFAKQGYFSTWKWDANFIYGRTEGTDNNQGRLRRSGLASAVGPSFFDDAGVARCGTPDAPIDGCTPLNLFGGAGSITDQMLRPLTYTGIASGFSEQRMINLETNGELGKLWDLPVSLAVGYQFRREQGGYTPDPLTASGDTTGNKQEATAGGYSENAGFAELNVPLLAQMPLVQLLEAQAAVRLFNFSSFGSGATYKLGGRWQLMNHVAFRGTYSTGFRAPAIGELYSGASDSFQDVNDPCSGDRANGVIDANCRADGVPDGFVDDATQLPTRVGGNPNLKAEQANIATFGIVLTPKFHSLMDGLSLAVDYFAINISNAIQAKGAGVIVNNCYGEGRADCGLIKRDAQGFITSLIDTQTNVGGNATSGVDFTLGYALPTKVGRWKFNFDGVWLHKFNENQPARVVQGLNVYDLAGVYPSLRLNTGASWSFQSLLAGFTVRYTGPIRECQNNDCSLPENLSRDVSPNGTVDLYTGYSFTTDYGFSSLQLGMNNVFNSDPPRIFAGFLANSDAATYDYLGRFFYMSFKHAL